MKRIINVDTVAGVAALGWAITALFVPQLNELIDYRAAVSFAVVALGRGFNAARKALPAAPEENPKEL